jgi:hypothetical protein
MTTTRYQLVERPADGVELIDATTVKPEPISWLWPGWLAKGKLHLLAGAPGTGKTTIALHLAACVSAGRALPSGQVPPPGNGIIWSGEDDVADTLLPRLLAAGADKSRIKFVGEVTQDGQRFPFDPARDVDKLVAAAGQLGEVALLIVDPLVSAVSGDSHKNAEVRRGLAPLVELAAKLGAALIGITHYSKGTAGRDPLERVTGSIAFGALPRIVFCTVRQEQEEGQPRTLLFARAKSNIGPDGGGFMYRLEETAVPDHIGLTATKIAWGAPVEGTARELLTESKNGEEVGKTQSAARWLLEFLADGPKLASEVEVAGNRVGHARRTLQRAMRVAGIESTLTGFGLPATWSIASHATVAPPNSDGADGATDVVVGVTEDDTESYEV